MKTITFVASLLLMTIGVHAQPEPPHIHEGASGLPHGIPDFCAIGGIHSADTVIVSPSETLNITGDWEHSCLGIHGVVNVANNAKIRADVILIYSDGTLNTGSETTPVTGVVIEIRDRPIDTTKDPEQFGQGILGFGKVTFYGDPNPTLDAPRSIIIRSENPNGTRGHSLFSQRADVNLQNVHFANFGRTDARRPLNSALFDSDGNNTRIGTNQIGRYTLHMHHVMGPLPSANRVRQFYLRNLLVTDDSKWGITVHNSHYGLLENNYVKNAIGSCFVEEDGSETDNRWINNYCKVALNTSMDGMDGDVSLTQRGTCVNSGYDPEARCASGFWLRGNGAVLINNTVEDVRSAFSWWNLCLEVNMPHTCSGNQPVTVPLFPGADTTKPEERRQCWYWELGVWSPNCTVIRTGAGEVRGNKCVRVLNCMESWWTQRSMNLPTLPVVNTTSTDAYGSPIAMHYSDFVFDGFTATTTPTVKPAIGSVAMSWFNHSGAVTGLFTTQSTIRNANIEGYDVAWSMTGQLRQLPNLTIENSTFTTTNGIRINRRGQGNPNMIENVTLKNVKFFNWDGSPALTTIYEVAESIDIGMTRINVTVEDFNNTTQDFEFALPSPFNPAIDAANWRPECTQNVPTVVSLTDGRQLLPVCTSVVPPPITPPAPTVTMVVATCQYTLTAQPPDTTTGWRAQFRKDGVNVGNADNQPPYTRNNTSKPGTYKWDVLWTKTGVPSQTSAATVTTNCQN